jgi:hypothetical protein
MSTTNIKHIISRYQTACGDNIVVYQFFDSEPKVMEIEFKKHFQEYRINFEFYDARYHFEYLQWCLNYTNYVVPVIGHAKSNVKKDAPRIKSIGVQCFVPELTEEPLQRKYTSNFVHPNDTHSNLFSCVTTDDLTRHMNKKTGCGVQTHTNDRDREPYIMIDDARVKCNACEKVMTKLNISRHNQICKGVPTNTCEYCFKYFYSLQGKCNHRKICKQNPANIPPITRPTIIQNINKIPNKFGNEDMSYLECRKEVDERYAPALACFSDTLDLVFFNSDHPENQTIRKTNKKSDLIELRINQDDWEPTESKVAIPKIKTKLESLLNVNTSVHVLKCMYCMFLNTNFKDMLHSKTQRGPISEQRILERHTK